MLYTAQHDGNFHSIIYYSVTVVTYDCLQEATHSVSDKLWNMSNCQCLSPLLFPFNHQNLDQFVRSTYPSIQLVSYLQLASMKEFKRLIRTHYIATVALIKCKQLYSYSCSYNNLCSYTQLYSQLYIAMYRLHSLIVAICVPQLLLQKFTQ